MTIMWRDLLVAMWESAFHCAQRFINLLSHHRAIDFVEERHTRSRSKARVCRYGPAGVCRLRIAGRLRGCRDLCGRGVAGLLLLPLLRSPIQQAWVACAAFAHGSQI